QVLALDVYLRGGLDERPSTGRAILFGAALAGAVLSKGLIGLLFPVAAVVASAAFSRRSPRLKLADAGIGSAAFLALAVPWHYLASVRTPGFFTHYFIN